MKLQPFPFLSLPKELRLMVYERIPINIQHHVVPGQILKSRTETKAWSFTLVDMSISLSILSACRQIHNEAAKLLSRRIHEISSSPPRAMLALHPALRLSIGDVSRRDISLFVPFLDIWNTKLDGTIETISQCLESEGQYVSRDSTPLNRVMGRWGRRLQHQRSLLPAKGNDNQPPAIEIAITADIADTGCGDFGALYEFGHGHRPCDGRKDHRYIVRIVSETFSSIDAEALKNLKTALRDNGVIGSREKFMLGDFLTRNEYEEGWTLRTFHRGSAI